MALRAARKVLPRPWSPQSLLRLAPRRVYSLAASPESATHTTANASDETSSTIAQDRPRKGSRLSAFKNGGRSKAKDDVAASSESPSEGRRRFILGHPSDTPIRTRFAPSPTGLLHLGSLRTALFNNLASEASRGGSFILRIEDTDQNRLVEGAEDAIIRDLKWLGLSWNEGPDCGGPHGPYKQSERLPLYKDHVDQLIEKGHAYRCFCDPAVLEKERLRQHEAGEPTVYPKTCRSIPEEESAERAQQGEGHVVRFKGDAFGVLKVQDAVYGKFEKKDPEEDFIIIKTDGYPTYHFANVVDDHLMKITHVIRGEEWLISTPKHLALYKAFGWQPPIFGHVGLLVNDDSTKLSKRQSSASLAMYKGRGISPIPLQIWLAQLGSTFTTKTDDPATIPRTLADVASKFSFKFTKGSIKLNLEKLDHKESTYRKARVTHPSPSPVTLALEEEEIKSSFIVPTLGHFTALTADPQSGAFVDPAWNQTKDPVPSLSPSLTERDSVLARIRDLYRWLVTATSKTSVQAMTDLPLTHPYLFWRVPQSLYRRSLVLSEPGLLRDEHSILAALDAILEDTFSSATSINQPLIDTVNPPSATAKRAIYSTHRLIMTGQPDISSPSVDFLLQLLGRDESLHRVRSVRTLAAELLEGGEPVRRAWLEDAWRRYPSFMEKANAPR